MSQIKYFLRRFVFFRVVIVVIIVGVVSYLVAFKATILFIFIFIYLLPSVYIV